MYGKYYTSANLCKHGTEHDLHLINSILKMIKPISRKKKRTVFADMPQHIAIAQGLSSLFESNF